MTSTTEESASPVAVRIAERLEAATGAVSRTGGVTLAAMGDLMLSGEWKEAAARGRLASGLAELGALATDADLVFANLETTCPGSEGSIPKEPRVVAEAAIVEESLRAVGVDVVNLANNHSFDCYWSGFEAVRKTLDEMGVLSLGAGPNSDAAAAPLTLQRGGIRFGLLAYADLGTRPSHVATTEGYGINALDRVRAAAEVTELRAHVDHVLVSIHWGVEYCHLPSPDHISHARSLVDAGASLVIGHHAHVVQGVEAWGDGAIVYNLGNATTTDHYVGGHLAIRQTPRTRSSFMLRADFGKESLRGLELLPIRSERGTVLVNDATARRILQRANQRLVDGVTQGRWKRIRLYEDGLLRMLRKLHPRVIGSVRPRHLVTLGKNLLHAIRGRQPV